MIRLLSYLNFNGDCKEAMTFYHSIFGGELKVQTFEDAKMAKSDAEKDRTMHAELKNDDLVLMASDGQPDKPVRFGNNIHLSLNGDDEAKLTNYFNKLMEGGVAHVPIAKQFWGDSFGMGKDKFEVNWMVNISGKK